MSAQQNFERRLRAAQEQFSETPKMPYLCIIGTHDFDELKEEIGQRNLYVTTQEKARTRALREWDKTPCVWDPEGRKVTFDDVVKRVEQEEFSNTDASPPLAGSPLIAEAEAALDPIQKLSLTEWFEYCGCKCFRSLNEPRGFWFA